MVTRINITRILKQVFKNLSLVVYFAIVSSAQAQVKDTDIYCGNAWCDTTTRRCVKYTDTVCYQSGGVAGGSTCNTYTRVQCVGKNEQIRGSSDIKVSTDANEHQLTADEIAYKKRTSPFQAEYTTFEKREIATEYYKDKKQEDISDNAKNILNRAKQREEDEESGWSCLGGAVCEDDTEDVINSIAALSRYTTLDGYYEGMGSPGDTRITDAVQEALTDLEDIYKEGYLTEEEYETLKDEIKRIEEVAVERASQALTKTGEEEKKQKLQEEMADVKEEYSIMECPTSDQLKARYGSGCWSCLVLEKLTSAFLHAANKGLNVVQKAGVTLLWIGAAIWIVFWGLKNVSSFTEVQLGNILNDLIKFLFKVAIAYWFIVYSSTAISKYFITPMMSVGAIIGQQFWNSDIAEFTEKWDDMTDADIAEFEKELQKPTPEIQTPVPSTETQVEELSEEEKARNEEANAQNDKIFGKAEIPNLLIPGLTGGILTSSYGCRPRPCPTCSKSHMGIDLAVAGSDSKCNPVIAAGPGTITYNSGGNGGYRAIVDHGDINGNNWKTYYLHMKNNSGSPVGSSKKIKQGEFIGCIGNTGVGTGAHLHFGVYFSGKVNGQKISTYVDPLSLPAGKICYIDKETCDGVNRKNCAESMCKMGESIKSGGYPAAGEAVTMISFHTPTGVGGDFDDLIVMIPEIKYTGPTNIMPKSVMNSILGATRAITNTTADVMVMGNMIMCYAGLKNGGAWHIDTKILDLGYWTNFVMWIQGGIIWCMGFMLTVAIAYYLVDISFKIGFAVLAIPVVMGLWPFGITQGKLYIALSIIAKSAATFAFLALTTYFGMSLISESVGGLKELYEPMDSTIRGATPDEKVRAQIADTLYLFSPTFILLMFSIIYFYKLVQQTISDLVNKFFPDNAFGDSSPMHSGATMMTSYAKKFGMNVTGAKLLGDIAAHQTGRLAKHVLRHPLKSAASVGRGVAATGKGIYKGAKAAKRGISKGINKLRGKK